MRRRTRHFTREPRHGFVSCDVSVLARQTSATKSPLTSLHSPMPRTNRHFQLKFRKSGAASVSGGQLFGNSAVEFPFEAPSVTNGNPESCGRAWDVAATLLQVAVEGGSAVDG